MGVPDSPVSAIDLYGSDPLNWSKLLGEGELWSGVSAGWQEAPRAVGTANTNSTETKFARCLLL